MDPLTFVGSLTGFGLASLALLASLAVAVVALLGLVITLERRVFGGSDAEPVGLERLERDEDVDGDAWR